MKGIYRIAVVILCLCILISSGGALYAYANSAQTIWSGVTSTGVIVEDEDCPLIVEQEILSFYIPAFPDNYYSSVDDFVSYPATVTAEYSFYNPADYTVTATLVFPFGNMPDYGMIVDDESGLWAHESEAHTQRYGVKVNGAPINSTLRHTFSDPYSDFERSDDLPRLRKGYAKDPFFSPEMTVTRYAYEVSGLEQTDVNISCTLQEDSSRKIYAEGFSSFSRDENIVSYGCWLKNQEQMILYAVGEPFEQQPNWKITEDGRGEIELEGTVDLVDTQTMTFKQFALVDYDPASGILETDWYNAFVDELNERYWEEFGADLSFNLMRWYEYQITLAPGERITNTVTAPVYPKINGQYEPPVYEYTYLLSPAQTWSEFGSLEVVIDTPYYLIQSNQEQFTATQTDYRLQMEGLPEGELTFSLSSEESPQKVRPYYLGYFLIQLLYLAIIAVPLVVVISLGVWLIRTIIKHVKKKEKS